MDNGKEMMYQHKNDRICFLIAVRDDCGTNTGRWDASERDLNE
jgi:hypothetical protein